MSFFLIALGSAIAVGLLRSWSLAVSARPPVRLVPEGVSQRVSPTATPSVRTEHAASAQRAA